MHASEFITCLWLLFASQALAAPRNSANHTVVTGSSTATFSLPASANFGDVVQISGAGAGWIASLP